MDTRLASANLLIMVFALTSTPGPVRFLATAGAATDTQGPATKPTRGTGRRTATGTPAPATTRPTDSGHGAATNSRAGSSVRRDGHPVVPRSPGQGLPTRTATSRGAGRRTAEHQPTTVTTPGPGREATTGLVSSLGMIRRKPGAASSTAEPSPDARRRCSRSGRRGRPLRCLLARYRSREPATRGLALGRWRTSPALASRSGSRLRRLRLRTSPVLPA
jgi:hypothetical protein